ncbi:HEAT repeat domain-containing protein [Thalassotalea euphylliae]|uniref:HEAT repeat domain-containing protein n=1 Tax=Thalassotalea euphylliae TaxID=1655234 RepID=UPI00362EE8AA
MTKQLIIAVLIFSAGYLLGYLQSGKQEKVVHQTDGNAINTLDKESVAASAQDEMTNLAAINAKIGNVDSDSSDATLVDKVNTFNVNSTKGLLRTAQAQGDGGEENFFLSAIKNTDSTREDKLNAIENLLSESSPQGVASALGDEDPLVREHAVGALASIGSGESILILGQVALSDPESFIRQRAVEALAELSHDDNAQRFVEYVAQYDPDQDLRAFSQSLLK